MKNQNRAHLDPYEMQDRLFNAEKDTMRVEIIDGLKLNASSINLPEQKIITIEKPVIIKEVEIKEIKVPVITKEVEVKIIEKPIIVKEVEVKKIEVPVIIKETEVKIIEIPGTSHTISSNCQCSNNKDLMKFLKVCIALQIITSVGILLIKLL